MKRITTLFLLLSMLFTFTACTEQVSPDNSNVLAENKNPLVSETVMPKPEENHTVPPPTETVNPGTVLPEISTFEIHYLDVGQADAALVLCDNKTMLIDGGNVSDSSLIVAYLKKQNINHLDYIIATHAHEDHIGGLSGALSVVSAGKVYAPKTETDSQAYLNFKDKVLSQGLQITTPTANEIFTLGSSNVKILAPVTEYTSNINNTSIVLKITYCSTSFLFTGDAEREAEHDILNQDYDLSANVLKVGHHGSESSTSYVFLRAIMPEYAIISAGKDNNHGHPTEETLSRLRDSGTKVYRTDLQGDIIVTSNGETVSVTPSRNADIETNTTITKPEDTSPPSPTIVPEQPTQEITTTYIGNRNTKKFHYPNCHSVKQMKESNKFYLTCSRDEAIAQGYNSCGNCHP